jgi:hypothetical protein
VTDEEQQVIKGLFTNVSQFPPYVELIGDEAVLDGCFNARHLRRIAQMLEDRERQLAGVTGDYSQ